MPDMIQTVWLTLSDGTKAGFCGHAVSYPGETRKIVAIHLTEPRPLPEGMYFEKLDFADAKPKTKKTKT